jgi:glutaredoxin 2
MTLGFLGEKYLSKVLPYDDEKTPIDLTGTKMLPIWQRSDGTSMNESLDIIKELDRDNRIQKDFLNDAKKVEWVEGWLNLLGSNVHNLAMPYWVWTPEFNENSRSYFENKKSKKRGPFNQLAQRRAEFEEAIHKDLARLEGELDPWLLGKEFSLADIMLAAHIWGLYVVPEFRFSDKVHAYLQSVKRACRFDYHADFWLN